MKRSDRRALGAVVMLLVAAGCGDPLGPEDLARIEVSAGNGQIASAGTAVETPPAIKAVDIDGKPIPGATVTFAVTSGGGTLTGAQATTSEEGIATIGSWTLGPIVGENVLSANAPGADAPVTFTAFGLVGPPATIEKVAGDGQTATAGRPVGTRPILRVVDQAGNAVSNQDVGLAIGTGGGELSAELARTDSLGEATVLEWKLGAAPGPNTVVATAGAASATFEATGVSGPVTLTVVAGDSQTTTAGMPVPISPQVLVTDAQDIAVPNIDVLFAAFSGAGSVSDDTVQTDANGTASVDWTVGTKVGPNNMFAEVNDVGVIVLTATGTAGAPAAIASAVGDSQFGAISQTVPAPPSLLVTDEFDNPVPGVEVTFTVSAGGGTITGSPATTDEEGIASATAWTLGPDEGNNSVEATVAGIAPLTFTATGLAEVFDFDVVRLGGGPGLSDAVEIAVNRWRQVLIGDLPNVSFAENPIDSTACGGNHGVVDDVVDDLRIFLFVEAIDGPGNILGSAGPCYVRDDGGLPVIGRMRFDLDDLPNLQSQGILGDVVVHEMGHVLGVGTLWEDFSFLVNPSLPSSEGADTHFNGPLAIAAFDAVGGDSFNGSKVPVENRQGGAGTRDAHWRESVFDKENMTGFVDQGQNPLSMVTSESLADMGYVVNSNGAETYSLGSNAPPLVAQMRAQAIPLGDDVWRHTIYVVERDGKITAVIRP